MLAKTEATPFASVFGGSFVQVGRIGCVQIQDACVEHRALLQCGPNRAVQAVFEVEVAVVLHDVREEVTKERRVLGQQRIEIKRALRGDEFRQPYLARRQTGPFRHAEAVLIVGTLVTNCLEDHGLSIEPTAGRKPIVSKSVTQTNDREMKGTPRVPVRARGPLLPSGPGGIDEMTPHEGSANTVRGAASSEPDR